MESATCSHPNGLRNFGGSRGRGKIYDIRKFRWPLDPNEKWIVIGATVDEANNKAKKVPLKNKQKRTARLIEENLEEYFVDTQDWDVLHGRTQWNSPAGVRPKRPMRALSRPMRAGARLILSSARAPSRLQCCVGSLPGWPHRAGGAHGARWPRMLHVSHP